MIKLMMMLLTKILMSMFLLLLLLPAGVPDFVPASRIRHWESPEVNDRTMTFNHNLQRVQLVMSPRALLLLSVRPRGWWLVIDLHHLTWVRRATCHRRLFPLWCPHHLWLLLLPSVILTSQMIIRWTQIRQPNLLLRETKLQIPLAIPGNKLDSSRTLGLEISLTDVVVLMSIISEKFFLPSGDLVWLIRFEVVSTFRMTVDSFNWTLSYQSYHTLTGYCPSSSVDSLLSLHPYLLLLASWMVIITTITWTCPHIKTVFNRAATWRVKCGQISERLSQLTIHSTSYLKRNWGLSSCQRFTIETRSNWVKQV